MESSNWAASVRTQLSAGGESSLPERSTLESFFKVLPDMRRGNEGWYDPIFFTFGPYHGELRSRCEHFKLQAAKALIISMESFRSLVAKIQERDSDIRYMYAEPWDHIIEPEALANLLALDALTIIAAACKAKIFQPPAVASAIRRDACLLEHQLPLFVLRDALHSSRQFPGLSLEGVVKVYGIHGSYPFVSADTSWREPSNFNQSMIGCIYDMLILTSPLSCPPSNQFSAMTSISLPYKTFNQFDCCCFSSPSRVRAGEGLSTASQLRRCGIIFKVARPSGSSFTAIRFNKATRVLSLPTLTVFNDTPSYLLNLVAYEVASRIFGPVSSYIIMIDCLVDEEEDVQVLVEAGVIVNQFGSHKELASLWNKLASCLPLGVTPKDAKTIKKINKACMIKWYKFGGSIKKSKATCKLKWRNSIAGLRDTYCDKQPWLLISIVAGFFLFVMTLLQTIYTMQLYYSQ